MSAAQVHRALRSSAGDCSAAYFDAPGRPSIAWTYKTPSSNFQPIKDHLAFYAGGHLPLALSCVAGCSCWLRCSGLELASACCIYILCRGCDNDVLSVKQEPAAPASGSIVVSVGHAVWAADVFTNLADMWVLCAVQESWTKPQWMARLSKCRYSQKCYNAWAPASKEGSNSLT